jgi:hypothetical protein
MSRFVRSWIVAVLILWSVSSPAVAEQWGTLRGTFIYDGKPPKPMKLKVNPGIAVCGNLPIFGEVITVGKNGGLKNIVLWVRTKDVDVHPKYDKVPSVILDNRNCAFTPHVVAVRTGQLLEITNSDPIGHNALITTRVNRPQPGRAFPPGGKLQMKFSSAERLPCIVACGDHSWMKAYVLIQDHPYMSVSGIDGTFELVNLPAGVDLEIQVWHETGYIQEITIGGKKTAWKRGRFEVNLEAGQELDFGKLLVAPKELE